MKIMIRLKKNFMPVAVIDTETGEGEVHKDYEVIYAIGGKHTPTQEELDDIFREGEE